MTRKINDLTGQQFGRLTVVEYMGKSSYKCRCNCKDQTEKLILASNLKLGKTSSCGCYHREKSTKHGFTCIDEDSSIKKSYNTYRCMMARCYNPNKDNYIYYGKRGIIVCDEWHDVSNFIRDMGPRPDGMTLDRKDANEPYAPWNCRWASDDTQQNNKRDTQYIEYGGVTLGSAQWARMLGIIPNTLHSRIRRGSTPEQALFKDGNLISIVQRQVVTRVSHMG